MFPSLPPADAPPLSGDAGRRELNLSQYVNTVMQLLCKEICEEKALPERRDYPAGGVEGLMSCHMAQIVMCSVPAPGVNHTSSISVRWGLMLNVPSPPTWITVLYLAPATARHDGFHMLGNTFFFRDVGFIL